MAGSEGQWQEHGVTERAFGVRFANTSLEISQAMRCPYCQTELPDHATECTHCDWVRDSTIEELQSENWLAAMLSFVPGLGHLYKGHLVSGVLLLCVGGPAFLLFVMLLAPQTFGLSLLLPGVFIAATAFHAFHLPDVRVHPGPREHAVRTLTHWGKRLHR